ncbi:hypothetical protein JW948_15540 [bacterium]|nr:hypothetical protein [bacterium]
MNSQTKNQTWSGAAGTGKGYKRHHCFGLCAIILLSGTMHVKSGDWGRAKTLQWDHRQNQFQKSTVSMNEYRKMQIHFQQHNREEVRRNQALLDQQNKIATNVKRWMQEDVLRNNAAMDQQKNMARELRWKMQEDMRREQAALDRLREQSLKDQRLMRERSSISSPVFHNVTIRNTAPKVEMPKTNVAPYRPVNTYFPPVQSYSCRNETIRYRPVKF